MDWDKIASLTPSVKAVVEDKGTERPFTGEYDDFGDSGTYLCRRCGLALFRSQTKFHSGCGWPSFDANLPDAVLNKPDADGRRTEILCFRCQAHLGHVFVGEGFTPFNVRHCVNSVSLEFIADQSILDTREAIFAAGCFWGVEYYFKKLPGVLKTEVGYCGGKTDNPTYRQICDGTTQHYEAIRVVYDPVKLSYEALVKYFFEIHDPSQSNGQGPDIGQQYQSAIFYYHAHQQQTAQAVIELLAQKGIEVATKCLPVKPFWRAENYHQDYYAHQGKLPYCHRYEKKF